MFKFKYAISYRCRPNKKAAGSECALNITTSGKLDKLDEQRKVLLMLSKIHRVNLDAIELGNFTLLKREFAPMQWVKDKLKGMFKRAAGAVPIKTGVR